MDKTRKRGDVFFFLAGEGRVESQVQHGEGQTGPGQQALVRCVCTQACARTYSQQCHATQASGLMAKPDEKSRLPHRLFNPAHHR